MDSNWSSYYSQVKIANNDGSRRCISSHNFNFSQNIVKIARPFGRRYPGDCLVSRNKCAELNGKPGSKESSKNLWPLMTGFRVMEIPINCFFLFLFLFCHGYAKRRNDYWICKFINNSVVKKWTSNHVPNYVVHESLLSRNTCQELKCIPLSSTIILLPTGAMHTKLLIRYKNFPLKSADLKQ